MIKVFISGSRRISRLNDDVRRRLDRIIESRLQVLIGDANGVDKAVQQYLHEKSYDSVEVFHTGDYCRNNLGGWHTHAIVSPRKQRDYDFYAAKDIAMADEATHGLAIWDGDSFGTLMNVGRLARQQKSAALHIFPQKRFVEIKNETEWREFVRQCNVTLRQRLERESLPKEQAAAIQTDQIGIRMQFR